MCRKGKWTLSHTCFYNYICFKSDRMRSEDKWCIPGETEVSLHHSFMTHIDTLTNKKNSRCNWKHSEKYIPSLWTVNKYKQHFILQEQTCWAKLVLGSMSHRDNKHSLNYIPWKYSASYSVAYSVRKDIFWISMPSTFLFYEKCTGAGLPPAFEVSIV